MLFSLSGLCETTGQKRLDYTNLLQVGLNLILSPGITVTPILSPGLENWSRDFKFFFPSKFHVGNGLWREKLKSTCIRGEQ